MDSIEGVVERITYHNEESSYTVLRLRPSPARKGLGVNQEGLVTVVGNFPQVNPGESLHAEGHWSTHPKHGPQFKAEKVEQILPASVEGIKRYLGSGLIKGIGPKMAARIVGHFGADTLQVIEAAPQRLLEVSGIGSERVRMITEAWSAQRAIKNIMIFLQGHGVSAGLAAKIYKQYGDEAEAVVTNDPYQLARDIWGIGFKTADKIAQNLGLPLDSPSRVAAGVAYALNESADDGHVYVPEPDLRQRASELLGVPVETVGSALDRLAQERDVVQETITYPAAAAAGEVPEVGLREEQAVYLAPFFYGEIGVTNRLARMLEAPVSRLVDLQEKPLDWLLAWAQTDVRLSEQQVRALRRALLHKVSVITGGPGTGKTTCLRTLIRVLQGSGHSFALASPTGRAAKRLSEATGQPAKTIHRLLGYQPSEGFKRDDRDPLDMDMLVVDEASMLDLLLMNNLLKAVPPESHLLLVGDVDQLPSVGAGDVLRDIIGSGAAPVTRLDTIFRQAQNSLIIRNAHRINAGKTPFLPTDAADFFMFQIETPDEVADWVVDIVQNRIPQRFGLDPLDDVQVLAPMYRGAAGVANLNQRLQEALNPPARRKVERPIGGRLLRVGDKVMQTRNNYDKDVFNGDIGRVVAIDLESARLTVDFGGLQAAYDWVETDELAHAFCVSVHKSQGSEYTAVVLPILTQHYMMLQRNLLYTAVTRARQLCVLVGSLKAVRIAVRNDKVAQRHSGLQVRLQARRAAPAAAGGSVSE